MGVGVEMTFHLVSSPLTILLLVVILSFVASLLSDKLKAPYPTVMIGIGLALSLLRLSGKA